jgi:hypothetical protein
VEHSKGNDGESAVAILRFLCGSPRSCRLRTVLFWSQWQALSCVLTTNRVFLGPGTPSSPVTTLPNRTPCRKVVVGGGMRPRAKTSPVGKWLSYVRPLGVNRMVCWSGFSPAWCILIRVAVILSVMSDNLSLWSSHSMFCCIWIRG